MQTQVSQLWCSGCSSAVHTATDSPCAEVTAALAVWCCWISAACSCSEPSAASRPLGATGQCTEERRITHTKPSEEKFFSLLGIWALPFPPAALSPSAALVPFGCTCTPTLHSVHLYSSAHHPALSCCQLCSPSSHSRFPPVLLQSTSSCMCFSPCRPSPFSLSFWHLIANEMSFAV